MGSHAADQGTASAASAGAQQQDQQLAQNAAQNQQFANQTRQSLFGNYNPSTGTYSGGSESGFLNPANLNQNGLQGTYLNQYNNASNNLANQTQNAVQTTEQNLNSRGMGRAPAGFAADQQRQAYQTQAGEQGSLYTGAAQQQHSDAMTNYWNATNMLNSNASQTANLSVQGNQAAAGNYSGLYGSADQQVPSGWAVAGQTLAGMGQAAGSIMTGMPKPGCWIAAELWGGWDDPRVALVRGWIFGPFAETRIGGVAARLYARFGERMAAAMRVNRRLRAAMEMLFNQALVCAVRTAEEAL